MNVNVKDHLYKDYSSLSEIQQFFYGQCVFLTGITGLVGKVLLEKLLRCCPGIGMVYVHLRPKKGLSSKQRMEKIFRLELFKYVRKALPEYSEKVVVVEGDITQENLGMSFDDYESIRRNVTIIIHSAANVNFVDPLRTSVEHNLNPVLRILELCHEISNFKAFVHLSTSFVKREHDGTVPEEIPVLKVTPFQILDAIKWMDDKSLKCIYEDLTEKKSTTYTLCKALAERLIEEKRGELPVAIVRPCFITPTFMDPFPGWSDALQGISGLFLAGSKGVLRTLRSVRNLKITIVPVDYVVNTIIASAWHVGKNKPPSLLVINCTLEYDKQPDADDDILKVVLDKRSKYPLAKMFRYPDFTIYYHDIPYYIHAFFDQWIPALIVDFFLLIFTGKTILMKVYYKIHTLYGIFYKMGKDPWIFQRKNYKMIMDELSEKDSKIFDMDFDKIDWMPYIGDCMLGGRKFMAHEDPSNIPYARKKAQIWWATTTTLKWIIIGYFLYYILNLCFFNN